MVKSGRKKVTLIFLFGLVLGFGLLSLNSSNESIIDQTPSSLLSAVDSFKADYIDGGSSSTDSEDEEEDPDEKFVGSSGEVLTISNEGFDFKNMELVVGDDLRVSNADERSHVLTIEDLSIEKSIQPGQRVRIEIKEGGNYRIESNRFDEEHVLLDVNAR